MNSLKNSLISLIAAFLLFAPAGAQETSLLSSAAWQQEQVAEGIVLRQAAFEGNLFGANQYLCVLEIAPGARFDIVPADDKTLIKTTDLAARTGAVAAINGSFFNMIRMRIRAAAAARARRRLSSRGRVVSMSSRPMTCVPGNAILRLKIL